MQVRVNIFPLIISIIALSVPDLVFGQPVDTNHERNAIQVSYFRSEFFEGNRKFDALDFNVPMIGVSLDFSRRLRPNSNHSLCVSVDYFQAGFYPIPEPFVSGYPAFKFIGVFTFPYQYDVFRLNKTSVSVRTGPRFRIGEESIFTYQYGWETNTHSNNLMDIGVFSGIEVERSINRRLYVSVACSSTRYLYRKTKGFPHDSLDEYNSGNSINTFDILLGIGYRFGYEEGSK